MTADWESVRETEEDRRNARLSDAEVKSTHAYSRATDALSYSKGALQHCRDNHEELVALRARVKFLEDETDIADRTAMWGCLLAAVSAGLAVGALIVAIIAEALRWSPSSATGAGTRPPCAMRGGSPSGRGAIPARTATTPCAGTAPGR